MGTMANSEDPDEMQHHAAFHQGLHCLLRLKQPSGTEIHHNIENFTSCHPLKYKMGSYTYCINIIVSAGKHFSITNRSDLSIVGTCDISVYRMRHQITSFTRLVESNLLSICVIKRH